MAQVAPGLGVRHVSPQEGRELLARVGVAGRESQVRQEGLGLLGGENERPAGVELCVKSPQNRNLEAHLRLQRSSQTVGKKRR